jgi:hypothetical protein
MAKSKKQIKKEQASMQSDALEMDNWIPSDGLLNAGTGTVGTVDSLDPDMGGMTYSFGDLGDLQQLDLFSEEDMRKKYPALKDAYEHYQNVLDMCKTREKEEDEN